MSNKHLTYMETDWFNGLKNEIAAASVTTVAARMGIARTTLSVFIHGTGEYGKGIAKPDAMELRYRRVFEQLVCTHTGELVGVKHCREVALRLAPTHNPLQMVQWQTCQQCRYKPAAVPADNTASAKPVTKPSGQGKVDQGQVQQTGIIDNDTLPLPEVGAPCVPKRRALKVKPVAELSKPSPVQQAGVIDKITMPLPEVGSPQIADVCAPIAVKPMDTSETK